MSNLIKKLIFFIFCLSIVLSFQPSPILAFVGFQKHPENPIFSASEAWEGQHIANPNIIFNDGIYKLWYQALNSKWKIGYASSLNGIDGWIRSSNPVIDIGSIDGWENEIGDPYVLFNSGKYKMWYSSINSNWANGGPDRMRLRYAESSDGISWTKFGWIMYGSIGKWDSGGSGRGHSILYKDGLYHIWYAGANDNSVFTDPYWRIGYATSPDGITWTKQNDGNPVIEPTTFWELNNVSFPNVIFENGLYHMWYAAGSGDAPTQFAYAYSSDGIGWVKPADQNPVLTVGPVGSFDSLFITQPSVFHEGDLYKMWYSGINGSQWTIGYATSPPIPIPSVYPTQIPTPTHIPTPTPTPTNTPTPTLTPTNTPIPTPTPVVSQKVIVIPGFGASWNADALMNCKIDGYQGSWSLHPLEKNIYPSLYTALSTAGYTPIPFYYDWRTQLGTQTEALSSLISSNITTNEHVDVVGHSFGGLVGRAYISEKQTNSKIDRYLSAGSPHRGTPFAYPAWAGGEIWRTDFNYWIYMTTMIRLCQIKYRLDTQDTIQRFIPSMRDLLPIFPYLRDGQTNQLKPLSSMTTINQWLQSHPFSPTWGIILGTLSGNGQKTLSSIMIKKPSKNDIRRGEWIDGKPNKKEYSNDGDGTILLQSSQLDDADNRVIIGDHASIVGSATGQQEIISFLNETQAIQSFRLQSLQAPASKKTSALLIMSYPAHVTLTNPDGDKAYDTDGMIALDEPKKGKYAITISPKRLGRTKIIVAQFYDYGKYFWKEYDHWLPTKKNFKIYIDPKNPSDDIENERHD